MIVKLNSQKWSVIGVWPLEWKRQENELNEKKLMDIAVTPWISAEVPGSVHKDLFRHNLIEDPYYELNSIKCEWVHNRAWIYKVDFKVPEAVKDRHLQLVFNGVDYFSYYYLNGTFLGSHEGMFTKVVFNIDDYMHRNSMNTLFVVIEKAPEEVAQMGETKKSRFQKSRFGYKWDFGTKLVNMGIWKDVELKGTLNSSVEDVYIKTGLQNDETADFAIQVKVNSKINQKVNLVYSIREDNKDSLSVVEETHTFNCDKGENIFEINGSIKSPKLWWPNGYGPQNLYVLSVKVVEADNISDDKELKFGIRNIEFIQNENSPSDSLPYTAVVNGRRVFIKGWNWVPLDHMYGSVDYERYEKFIRLAKKGNVNLLRIWGGGLIEKEEFYELCDRNGIMVWQEFIQSSASISNETNKEEKFLKLLYETSKEAVVQKRNHACLAAWCGGNELIYEKGFIPQDYNDKNIKMLKILVEEYDPGRMYFPTSPSGPSVHFTEENAGKNMHHDVHGMWNYEGVLDHYNKYNMMDCLLHSEFGAEGCSRKDVIDKVISSENQFPANRHNLFWNHHGAAWWDISERDNSIFGTAKDLEQIIKCSQFIQAEALRYIVESCRRRKYHCSGCIPWQYNEPWPNATCTNAVDYFGNAKMAYYWLKNSYEKIHASLRYNKLFFCNGEKFKGNIFLNNSSNRKRKVAVTCDILDIHGRILNNLEFDTSIKADECLHVGDICWMPEGIIEDVFFARILVRDEECNVVSENTYIFSIAEKQIFRPLIQMESADVHISRIEKHEDKIWIYAVNKGSTAALFVNFYAESASESLFCNENFSTIYPKEEKLFLVEALVCGENRFSPDSSIIMEGFNLEKTRIEIS